MYLKNLLEKLWHSCWLLLGPLMLVTASGIGIALLTYWLVLSPAQERLTQAEAAYQEERHQLTEQKEARKIQERMKAAQAELDEIWKTLPAQGEFTSLAVAISELGRREHVSIPGMTYALQKSDGGLPAKASLTFRAVGEYESIYRFLHRIETAESYLVVESLDAARSSQPRGQIALIEFGIKVVTFLRPEPPSRGES